MDQAALVQYPEATLYGADLPGALKKQRQEILAKTEAMVRKQGPKSGNDVPQEACPGCRCNHAAGKTWPADVIVLGTRGIVALIVSSWAAVPSS